MGRGQKVDSGIMGRSVTEWTVDLRQWGGAREDSGIMGRGSVMWTVESWGRGFFVVGDVS